MYFLSSLFAVLVCTVPVSFSSPLPIRQKASSAVASPTQVLLHTFNTGPTTTAHHNGFHPTLYRRHRRTTATRKPRDVSSDTKVFWGFGHDDSKPTDLLPVQDVLEVMAADPDPPTLDGDAQATDLPPDQTDPDPAQQQATSSPGITYIPSSTTTPSPSINVNPTFDQPRIPQVPIPIATPTSTSTSSDDASTTTSRNPATAAALAHKHKIVFVAVIVGTIAGLGITISICKLLGRSGWCNCGGRKSTGAGRLEDKEKRLSWKRLGSPPANLGTGSIMAGVGTPGGKVTVGGRNYDEKGIERNPNNKGVSFEDDEKVMDIVYEAVKPDLRGLLYQPPSNNPSAVPTKLGIVEPLSLGLKVGQTLNPAHFTTAHLTPTSFFDNDDHVFSTSSSRHSNISIAHSRTKSAPVTTENRNNHRESNKSGAMSSASSEWDVARAYGGPRYDKARSAGAMSGMSVDEREWERTQRISDRSSR